MRAIVLIPFVSVVGACSNTAPSALAERVQRLEDERDVRDVLVRYGESLDAKDHSRYASLFASDGTATTGFGSATGPTNIETLLEENLGEPPPGYVNKDRFHLMTTMVVEVDGDAADARSRYTVFEASRSGRPSPVHSGRYVDRLVREDGAWKIRARTSYGVIPYREPPPDAPR